MTSIKQAIHSLNLSLQLTSIILMYIMMTITFWVTNYNILRFFVSFNVDYMLLTLKSGGLTLALFLGFVGCLFTTALFNDNLKDEEESE